ncbi:MAG: YraN family protein [candidate division WOR-3 bacterium]
MPPRSPEKPLRHRARKQGPNRWNPLRPRKGRPKIDPVKAGRRAEEEAAEFLRSKGYVIVARNFKIRGGEADIIAWDGDVLVFVEVKSSAGAVSEPLESLGALKRNRMVQTAEQFLVRMGLDGVQVRFDAISVTPDGIKHYPDAFRP